MLIHAPDGRYGPSDIGARSPELDALMAKYAEHYEIPEELVRRVAKRERTFNPAARNGPYLGLMQISHATAKGMGYRGTASGRTPIRWGSGWWARLPAVSTAPPTPKRRGQVSRRCAARARVARRSSA